MAAEISYQGQTVIVTGAGRGMGRAYAIDAARRGASVVVNDIGGVTEEKPWADAVVEEIVAAGGKAVSSAASVMTAEGGADLVGTALSAFGRVDAVINNAGFLRPAMFEDLTARQRDDVIDVHLMAAFYVTQPAWREMIRQGYGRVVFTSSSAAFGNLAGTNYSAAKAGLIGMAAGLAMEGAPHNICTNCIMPFAISDINKDNPIMGADSARNRAALDAMAPRRAPESVVPLVSYLASSACAVNGQIFSALAGRYARVALAIAEGWIGDPATTGAEDIAAHLGEITAMDKPFYPGVMFDEIANVLARLQTAGLV
jgi:NAD(P)-dependent dehydrogenase (short-subunit alcohol dehydrogenase family)